MTIYGKVLLLIVTVDQIYTSIGIYYGFIEESNIMIHWLIDFGGIPSFVGGKMAITLLGLACLETVWRNKLYCRSVFRRCYFYAVAGYIFLYTVNVAFMYFLPL